jgi:hypothetical protein
LSGCLMISTFHAVPHHDWGSPLVGGQSLT